MNIRAVPAWKAAGLAQLYGSNHDTTAARKFAFRITRRQFGGSVAGTAVTGGALASGLLKPGFAKTLASFAPVPIPGGTPGLGGKYHVFGPGPAMGGDPIDAEPSTITDFNGFVGLAYLNGMVTRTNTKTGTSEKFPFLNSDMRFMDGEFLGTDGHIHQGTFALVWVDVYQSSVGGDQIHDLNPSQFPPLGLFWTIELPEHSVEVQLGKGSASMQASDVPILDYQNLLNALFGGGPEPVPGSVSFKVVWSGVDQRVNIRNTDPTYGGFAGEFIRNRAQMEWTATVGDYTFVSDALAVGTSSSGFAEIGHERNGSFFPQR